MLEKVQNYFHESIQNRISVAGELPEQLINAAERIVSCLLQGNKVIVCGDGRSYINAQLFVANLQHRYDIARPSLAASLLQYDNVLAACLAQAQNLDQLYKKQFKAIAKQGDILVIFAPKGEEKIIQNTVQNAVADNISVLAFTSLLNSGMSAWLGNNDLEIRIPLSNEMRAIEEHHFCVNLLSELIDNLLFNPTPY